MAVQLNVELIRPNAKLPVYSDPEDAGMDIYACLSGPILIYPGETVAIPTGLKMNIPSGWYLSLVPRSGISMNTPLRVANSPGTIDSGYKDEIKVLMTNTSPEDSEGQALSISGKGNQKGTYAIMDGERIAQLILCQCHKAILDVCNDVSKLGTNRGGGLGHSGIH